MKHSMAPPQLQQQSWLLILHQHQPFCHHPSTKWRKMGPILILLLYAILITDWVTMCKSELYDTEGPQFIQEPSRYNHFTNVQGLILQCAAKGSPQPQISWTNLKDGQPVHSHPGLREVYSNGTIYFPPFSVSFYRPDVHDQIYICIASNPVGKIRSRDIQVRAVINQRYDVRLENTYATEGNDALLKCLIPDPVKDFVSVTSWIKDTSFNIFPHSGGGGRYFMVPSGELLIEDVSRNDSASSFRCRTVNRLTGETQLSENTARLQLTGGSAGKKDSSPHIHSRVAKLRLKEGEVGVLLCLSEGHPPPSHWWMKENGYGGFETFRQTERIRLRKSAVIIENVGSQDSGIYVCYANNSLGSDRHQIDVVVTSSLGVQVLPAVLTVDIGKSADFTCWTNSPDESSSASRQITWKKDGADVRASLRISLSASADKLRIATVQREDKGIYQCFVKSDSDMSQASAELRLGDAYPQLVYRFIEQTLRPGPAVSLKCSAQGNPTPHITWLLDGFPLPHSERLLIGQYVTMNGDVVSHVNITSTRVEDGGEFKCTASNKLGTATHSARLNIYGPPFVRHMPSSITAVAGKVLTIKCPVAGYPISTITWEKDGQALPLTRRQIVTPDGTLSIRDVDRGVDSGAYSCIASNKQGNSDRKGVQVIVVVPPKITPFSFPDRTVEGGNIVLACVVSEGDAPLQIKWLKDMHVVDSSSGSGSASESQINIRQISDFKALVLQIANVKSNDAGNYSCVAKNSAGEVRFTAQLIVHVPPRIAPFSFPPQVSQGRRISAICSVEQQDIEQTNLTIVWLKNMQPIQSNEEGYVRILHVDAYSTMLIIDRVDSIHTGNYTCKISNSVDEVSATAPLVVSVPPRWVVEPKETEVTEGSAVTIPCQADGFPSPTIAWKKALGNRPENYRDISMQSLNNGQPGAEETLSYANGTLLIRSSKKLHQGFYLCEASNSIGSGLSKVIRLVVNVPVKVKEPMQNVTAKVGANAALRCEMSGDAPITGIAWRRGLSDINPDVDFRYQIRSMNNTSGIFSELTVNNVGREDTARYICSGANRHGRSQASLWLYVQEPPDTPRNLHVISKGSRFLRLGWILTQDGNSPIIKFTIQYKEETSNGMMDSLEIVVPGHVFTETVGNLRPATTYHFFVVAENQVGQSERSEGNVELYKQRLEVRTDGEAPEGRPRNVRVAPVSSTDIQATWEHPDKVSWHGQLLGYYVGYKRYREGEQYQFSTVEGKDSMHECLLRNLTPFTAYEVVVQAYNGMGAGPLSEPMIATTLEDVPISAPEGAQCSPLTSQNIRLSWSALSADQARGLVKGYKVFLERSDFDQMDADEPAVVRTTSTPDIYVSSLAKYTNYSVQVQAYTSAGDGPLSLPIYCHTKEDSPGSPAAIKTIVSSSSSMIVSWLPPSDPNGILTKYTVYTQPSDSSTKSGRDDGVRRRTVPSDITRCQFDGLKVDDKYEFRVSASTRVGEGNSIATYRTQSKHVGAAVISFGVEHRIVWKKDIRLSCETVGNPVIQWTRYSEVVRDSERFSGVHDGALLIRNARREDSGNYTCNASSKNGYTSESITHRLVVQVPPLSPLLSATGSTHNAISMQWKLSDSGGAPIKGYILHMKASEEWIERRLPRHLSSYELQALECGSRYQLYLTAYNRAGMGRASEMVNTSTLGSVPSLTLAVPQFMVQHTNETWAKVLLKDVWSSNGCPIIHYRVFYKAKDDSRWQTVVGELKADSRFVDLIGLKAGTSYQLKVIATNSAGSNYAEVAVNTPSSSSLGAETSTNIMNESMSIPFYLDIKLMVPILLSSLVIIAATGGLCLCFRKKSHGDGRSSEHLSVGTPSSSTYFKQNQQRNSQQIYMTVKKSTPIKSVDVTDLEPIPQYAEDIYPYATFEINEPRRDSRCNTSIPTLDRRRSSAVPTHRNPVPMGAEQNMCGTNKKLSARHMHKQDESEEYDSFGSDSDCTEKELGGNNRFVIRNNDIIPPSRSQHKFPEYDSHTRCGNRYEFVPPTNHMLKFHDKLRPLQNEYHVHPPGKSTGRKTISTSEDLPEIQEDKYLIHHSKNSKFLGLHHFGYPMKHLDPPAGFGDPCEENGKRRKSKSKDCTSPQNEFAIAV